MPSDSASGTQFSRNWRRPTVQVTATSLREQRGGAANCDFAGTACTVVRMVNGPRLDMTECTLGAAATLPIPAAAQPRGPRSLRTGAPAALPSERRGVELLPPP